MRQLEDNKDKIHKYDKCQITKITERRALWGKYGSQTSQKTEQGQNMKHKGKQDMTRTNETKRREMDKQNAYDKTRKQKKNQGCRKR